MRFGAPAQVCSRARFLQEERNNKGRMPRGHPHQKRLLQLPPGARYEKTKKDLKQCDQLGHALQLTDFPNCMGGRWTITCKRCALSWNCLSEFNRQASRCVAKKQRPKNLRRKASWWAKSRLQLALPLAAMVKAWALTWGEVQQLDAAVKPGALKKQHYNVPWYQALCPEPQRLPKKAPKPKREWQRDLVQDGDIESNPGPLLSCVSLNCNGSGRTYNALKDLAQGRSPPAALLFQEVQLSDPEKFKRRASSLGYVSWVVQPPAQWDALGRQFYSGGVAVLFSSNFLAAQVSNLCDRRHQAITVQVGVSLTVCNVYRSPSSSEEEDERLQSYCLGVCVAKPRSSRLVFVGDWNQTPTELIPWLGLRDSVRVSAVLEDGRWVPSRWDSSRCLDYALADCRMPYFDCSCDVTRWSDHKAFRFNLQGARVEADSWCLVPAVQHFALRDVELRAWRRALAAAWKEVEVPAVSNTEDEWEAFNQLASQIFSSCGAGAKQGFENPRPEGSFPGVRPGSQVPRKQGSCRALSWAKYVGQLFGGPAAAVC